MQRTVQTGIPDEDSDTLLRLSGIEYGLSCRASADRVSLYDVILSYCLSYLRVFVTTRAAAFNTRCSLSVTVLEDPHNRLQQYSRCGWQQTHHHHHHHHHRDICNAPITVKKRTQALHMLH